MHLLSSLNLFNPDGDPVLSRSILQFVDFLDRRLKVFSSPHIFGEYCAGLQVAEPLAIVPANPNRVVIRRIVGLGVKENFFVHAACSDDVLTTTSVGILVKDSVDLRAELPAAMPWRNWRESRGCLANLVR